MKLSILPRPPLAASGLLIALGLLAGSQLGYAQAADGNSTATPPPATPPSSNTGASGTTFPPGSSQALPSTVISGNAEPNPSANAGAPAATTPPPSLTIPPAGTGAQPTASGPAPAPLTRPATSSDAPSRPTIPPPPLPPPFASFARDFKPKDISKQKWLTVQIGTVEIANGAPPDNQPIFVMPAIPDSVAADFRPVELACLLGTKSHYENVSVLEYDPARNPLGYSLPMGRVIYFLAREEVEAGISVSLYYYDASSLDWLTSPTMKGAFVPRTTFIERAQDYIAPAESYVFIYLNARQGPSRPGSTREATLYNYLVVCMHKVEAPAAATGAAPTGPFMGEKL